MELMNPDPPPVPDAVRLRRAVPGDARAISLLYERAYTTGNGEARDQYPFPQVFEPGWVAEAVAGGSIVWVVAEVEGELVASTAAVRNIGGRRDRIGEVFGVVVENEARRKGIATRLLGFLCAELEGEADFVLCEARTAEPGGWKAARNCGFLPVGFEPLAHAMPVGFEPMVLTARLPAIALSAAVIRPGLTPAAEALATTITQRDTRRRPAGAKAPLRPRGGTPRLPSPAKVPRPSPLKSDAMTRRGAGSWSGARGTSITDPGSSASDPSRERTGSIGATSGPTSSASAAATWSAPRAVWDRTDRRARILDVRVERDDLRAAMLAGTTLELLRMAADAPLVVIVNVRADTPDLQRALEQLQFFPTAYYPGLIAAARGRCDAIQFTRLHLCRIEQGLDFVADVDWPQAKLIVDQVLNMGRSAR